MNRHWLLLILVIISCQKEPLVIAPQLRGHWKYVGYIDENTRDTIPPLVYHECDSCMSLIFSETVYYGRSSVKKIVATASTKGNKIVLSPWDSEEAIGEVGIDEIFWTGISHPDTWDINAEYLTLNASKKSPSLIFIKE